MFEIEALNYLVKKGGNVTVRILRHGGANGRASVSFQTVPGTAVGGKDYIERRFSVVFEDSENVGMVVLETIGERKVRGNLTFFGEIVALSNGAIVGLQKRTLITVVEVGNQINGVGDIKMSQGSEKSIVMMVICGVFICLVVWFALARRSDAMPDQLASLMGGQRLYLV
jgi:hypothetical protein